MAGFIASEGDSWGAIAPKLENSNKSLDGVAKKFNFKASIIEMSGTSRWMTSDKEQMCVTFEATFISRLMYI